MIAGCQHVTNKEYMQIEEALNLIDLFLEQNK